MATKTLNSRVILKHDTAENWGKAENFIPKKGEVIVYDIDDGYNYERFKIGDDINNAKSLPFYGEWPKNGIRLIDEVNGYIYTLAMRNGELVTYIATDRIEVTRMPNKTSFMEGEDINTEGIIVTAYGSDGSTKDITELVTIEADVDNKKLNIIYPESGTMFTTEVNIEITPLDPAIVLVDFNYTDNGDGTYTITDWKGTTNGVAGTEIIVPNSNKIIL